MDRLTHLAHAARLGNAKAFDAFVETSHPDVWRLCAALVDPDTADDLAQETFLRAMRAVRRFRGDSAARTWILAIARRVCMDELRARTRRRRRDDRMASATSTDDLTSPDHASEIEAYDLIARLDPDRRAAFLLTQVLRLSYEEAAVVCDCPIGTIRSRVARGRDELISHLGLAPSQAPSRRLPRG